MNQSHAEASQLLSRLDTDWAHLIATVGECTFEHKQACEPYEALVRAVAGQQLHIKAAAAITLKFINHFGAFPAPQQLLAASFENLRACGFSGRKIETIQGIATATLSGIVPNLADAQAMTNDALIKRLVTLKGIGRWTVEMFLMFTLGRMDVLPADDFGVVQGYKRLKKLEAAPKAKEMTTIAEAFSPYRTVASWYLWRVPKD